MPAKSKKQQKFFGIVHALQKGKKVKGASKKAKKVAKSISKKSVKDFAKTKRKKLPNKLSESLEKLINFVLTESEYTFSKFKELKTDEKSFDQILSENEGTSFDIKEMLTFQQNQENFGESGTVSFILNKKSNEIFTKFSLNDITKKYVFKKLKNQEMKGFFNYVVFIQKMDSENKNENVIYAVSQSFQNDDVNEKTNILSDFIKKITTQEV